MKIIKNISLLMLIYSVAGIMTLLTDEIAKHQTLVSLVVCVSSFLYFITDAFDV